MMAEAFYRLKSAGGAWTRVTGTAPITVTGLTEGATYEYLKGDGTIGEVTAGAAATVVPDVTASDSLSGRDLTISVDSLTGDPSPSVALTSLTLEGANVLGNEVGSDPWVYTMPDSESSQTVAWTLEATNSGGTDTASGSASVSANLFAPAFDTQPSITGVTEPGGTVTLNEGTFSGTTPITATLTLTLDGTDVTSDVSGSDYTIPAGTDGQDLVLTVDLTNGIAPAAQASVTETVQTVGMSTGDEMRIFIGPFEGEDYFYIENPQDLVLTDTDLSLEAADFTRDATIEALDDTSTVVATATVAIGSGVLTLRGPVADLFPNLDAGFYTFRARIETVAAYTVPEAPAAATTMQSSVTKNGVTFTFDQDYPVGQYANGDYFVVAPSGGTLVSTSPAAETTSATSSESGIPLPDRTINGMGVNPQRRSNPWDSYYKGTNDETNTSYWAAKNLDPGKEGPYAFSSGESLVKAVSLTTPPDNSRPAIEKLVVLTVVSQPPKDGAFRPPPWGDDKDIPDSWRVENIDWSKVPEIDVGQPTPNWTALADQALVTWQTGNLWGNGVRNMTPDEQPTYRRDIGEKMGDFLEALASPGSRADKEQLMIGTLQIGLDQVVAGEITNDLAGEDPSERYDIGRRGVSVLASLLLPETQRLDAMLANDWIWQDTSTFGYITQDVIDHKDDDTERGAVDGMLGIPEYANARPQALSGTAPNRPDLIWGAIALQGTTRATYRRIGLQAGFRSSTAIHLFPGAAEIYANPAHVNYHDRWLALVEAGWPGVGEVDVFGVPTGYMSGSAVVPPSDIDFFKAVRGQMDVPQIDTLGLMPERPEPPELIENGTQIIVRPSTPYVGYGAAQTQIDIRYIETVESGTVTFDGVDYPAYTSVGSWTEINDAQPNPNGDYLVSPTPLGGLADNTRYCVAIRYRSTRGIGPWSNNWTFGYAPGTTDLWEQAWLRGVSTTTTERAATTPTFLTQPKLESYYTEGRPIRVLSIDTDGFPVPAVSYQWLMDGTPVPGETSDVFLLPSGSAGQTPSVEVTLTNTEGSTSTTVAGGVIAVGAGDTGYRPARYDAEGDASIYIPADNPINMMPTTEVSKATFAMWVGQQDFAFQARGRSAIFIGDGSVSVNLTDSGGATLASYTFGDYRPAMAWYLISIDASEANNDDKIKVWRKVEGSPFPPERLPIISKGPELTSPDFVLARQINNSGYWQRVYIGKPDEEFSTLSDYWAKDGVALDPTHFWNDAGYPYNVDNVGTASDGIGVPNVRLGGSQTESEYAARENTGSVGSPLPVADPGTPITQSGFVNIGD